MRFVPHTPMPGHSEPASTIIPDHPIYRIPAFVRKELKTRGPRVEIGRAWKTHARETPEVGTTPVFTARLIEQLGGTPDKITLDPLLVQRLGPPPPNFLRMGYAVLVAGLVYLLVKPFL